MLMNRMIACGLAGCFGLLIAVSSAEAGKCRMVRRSAAWGPQVHQVSHHAVATQVRTLAPAIAAADAAPKDIVDTAVGAGKFNTLVAAVKAAGLVETLKGKGPFTVFAPNDAAFAKLPAGTVEDLLKPENKDKLVKILTYHVVPGNVLAADVVKLTEAKTVQGSSVKIAVKDGKVSVDGAQVIATDIKATNGTIHVIDAVILPK